MTFTVEVKIDGATSSFGLNKKQAEQILQMVPNRSIEAALSYCASQEGVYLPFEEDLEEVNPLIRTIWDAVRNSLYMAKSEREKNSGSGDSDEASS